MGAPGDGNAPIDNNNWSQIVGTKPVGSRDRTFLITPLSLLAYVPTHDGERQRWYQLD